MAATNEWIFVFMDLSFLAVKLIIAPTSLRVAWPF